jgi:hypothetical protein
VVVGVLGDIPPHRLAFLEVDVSEGVREPGQADPWRTRRVMRLYASGETIPLISRSVGWSEGRVRKVLREAGVVLTEEGAALKRRNSEEARRRLLVAGWEARTQGGLVIWRRPDGRGSWYSQEVASEILEADKNGKEDSP